MIMRVLGHIMSPGPMTFEIRLPIIPAPAALVVGLAAMGPSPAGGQNIPAPMPVQVRAQWAEPASYQGRCPVTIRFHAAIRGTWGEVVYQWERPDGVLTEPERFSFNSPSGPEEERIVTMEWAARPETGAQLSAGVKIVRDMYREPRGPVAPKAAVRVLCTDGARIDACAYDRETGPPTSQVVACSQQRADEARAALSAVIEEVRAGLRPGGDAPAEERERDARRSRAFEATQSAWQRYVDAACEAAYLEIFPGSMARAFRLSCLERLTRERVTELKETYFPSEDERR